MPKEIRKPKSDWHHVLDEVEREDSMFWKWKTSEHKNGFVLHVDLSRKSPPPDLMERVAQFGERIVRFVKKVPRGINYPENNRLISQLVGAGTSIGANYCEADDAVSGKEFKQKTGFSRKESKETMFFLRMIAASDESLSNEARVWRK